MDDLKNIPQMFVSSAIEKNEAPLLKASQVAQILGIHINTVRRIEAKELPFYRLGIRGDRRYRPCDVNTFLEKRRAY